MRIKSLAMLTTSDGEAYLAEEYGKVIENVQKGLLSARMKNQDLSGDPTAGSVVAKRFKNAQSQAYGTARAGHAGNKVRHDEVEIKIDEDREFVEELETKDTRLLGVEGVVARRSANHSLRMQSELDTAFFAVGSAEAAVINLSTYANIEDQLEAIIQECETLKNDFVDGVPREMMNLVLSPMYYGKIRTYLDKVQRTNVDTSVESFYVYHGVRTDSCVHLPNGCNCLLLVDGAIAQPVMPDKYKAEKIPLSNAYALELFFSYGTKAVTPDLIFKKGEFTEAAAFEAGTQYYTKDANGVYTACASDLSSFAASTTYYTMA